VKAYLAIFLSVLVAKLGDKTQLATLLFAASPGIGKTGVFVAASLALIVSTLVAVLAGGLVAEWVPASRLRVLAGVAFLAIGAWMLLGR
jgi:putative Ca2+/H+ antiporter (TMEM165/GDT1 family)